MSPSTDHDDVRALLGRALAGEPPLTLDRDEVFRQGRRRLRNRRLFSTGGAIAGVVVAAVGAVVLTGLGGTEPADELPPAASPAPSSAGPPSTSVPPSDRHADALTAVLLDSGLLDKELKLAGPGDDPARFRVHGDGYDLRTDAASAYAQGSLQVSVAAAPDRGGATCASMPEPGTACEVRAVRGGEVAVGTWKDYKTGEKRYIVSAVRRDGTSVTAIATNLSEQERKHGKVPSERAPIVAADVLVRIATLPDLRFAG